MKKSLLQSVLSFRSASFTFSHSFGLLEVIIAVAIFTLFAGSIVSVISLSSKNMVVNKHRLQAANLAREGIELVTEIRDTAWFKGDDWVKIGDNNYGGPNPEQKPCWGLSQGIKKIDFLEDDFTSYPANCGFGHWRLVGSAVSYGDDKIITQNSVKFTREVIVEDTMDIKKITAKVTWDDFGQTKTVEMATLLTDWK